MLSDVIVPQLIVPLIHSDHVGLRCYLAHIRGIFSSKSMSKVDCCPLIGTCHDGQLETTADLILFLFFMKRWCLKTLSRVPLLESDSMVIESMLGYKHLSPLTVFFHFNLLRSGLLPHLFASLPACTDSLTDFVYIAANAYLGLSTCYLVRCYLCQGGNS